MALTQTIAAMLEWRSLALANVRFWRWMIRIIKEIVDLPRKADTSP
jgi:hypothetical protein